MDEVTSSKDSSQNTKKRGKFSGRIGYVLAVAGSAVGLGNIWRFPYLAAKYGGGIFLLIYLLYFFITYIGSRSMMENR